MAEEEALNFGASSPALNSGPVVHIMNTLQDIFAQLGSQSTIELPQVAVVGSQSSGKSSVLEALVGRDFLPKGSDICTRRPLVLQLIQTKLISDDTDAEWGEFLHLPGKKFYDFSEIRSEIQAETEREAGANKGVSDNQIRLKIFSPYVLDITLVDLPGITKNPVGDQPFDIEAKIRTMIMSYIKHSSCLILAVTPANADLANSDALQIARIADPDGYRTIGVITKLDIMDRGTDAHDFLLGKIIPLRLGYIGVVNRSEEDILMNRSITDALIAEEKFFRSHLVYSDLADCCGASQLGKHLNQLLAQHIKTVLPELKLRIGVALESARKEHASCGCITEEEGGMNLLLNILSMYSEAFSSMVEGSNEEMLTSELFGRARINYIFQNIFVKSLEEMDAFKDLSDEEIRIAIQNISCTRSTLFWSELPFQLLVRRPIGHLLEPSLQCAKLIYDELIRMSHRCLMNELQRFPVLRKHMNEIIEKFLQERLQPLESWILVMIEIKMDNINTSHPKFIEMAREQCKSYRVGTPAHQHKDGVDANKAIVISERSLKSHAMFTKTAYGIVPSTGLSILSRFDNLVPAKGNSISKPFTEPVQSMIEHPTQLREPPNVLMPPEIHSDQDRIELTKLLIRSYFDIVRGIVEDLVPDAIMHFLVNYTNHKLHNLLISKLHRENPEELLQESNEIAMKRKQTKKKLRALQQAIETLDSLSNEIKSTERGNSLSNNPTSEHQTPSIYTSSNSSADAFTNPFGRVQFTHTCW